MSWRLDLPTWQIKIMRTVQVLAYLEPSKTSHLRTKGNQPRIRLVEMISDFNYCRSHREKKGGNLIPNAKLQDFNEMIFETRLFDLASIGLSFTWRPGVIIEPSTPYDYLHQAGQSSYKSEVAWIISSFLLQGGVPALLWSLSTFSSMQLLGFSSQKIPI